MNDNSKEMINKIADGCFFNINTTGIALETMKKKYIGFELNKEYVEIVKKRIEGRN